MPGAAGAGDPAAPGNSRPGDYLIAGHRSAEPAHERVLVELGLEPLLDLRLRLGEGSGAALAVPLIRLAARLHAEMRRFDEAGVEQADPEATV